MICGRRNPAIKDVSFQLNGGVVTIIVRAHQHAGYKARYSALFGKALRLDVELVTLEDVRGGQSGGTVPADFRGYGGALS